MPQDYSDHLAFWFHTVTNVFGIFFNSLLTYLIITNTPKPLKPYGVLLLNVSLSDLLACMFAYMSMTRIITTGEAVCFFYHGPCTWFGGSFCFYCYAFMLHWFAHNLFILFMSFIYRYYVLKYPAPSRTTLWIICILVYLPSFSQFSSFCFSLGPESKARENLRKYHPQYDLDAYVITGNEKLLEPLTLYTTLYMCAPVAPMYLMMLYCRHKVYTSLNTVQSHLSENTKKTHRQLMKLVLIRCFHLDRVSSLMRRRVRDKPSVTYFTDNGSHLSETIPA
ncbi:hypothetical protein WR25_02206 [Diploscapter pachys]|uniref:G-protein coupled receptors family 1 profile domain-containing protein n=1 Tax=Diploscapter pachys TaxID=2018661 RepID=A0A2A2J9I3_9BILA|nr:hypothetical protein WR25_02206 [Diploscapter pachys]